MKLIKLCIFILMVFNVEGGKKFTSLGVSSEKFTIDLFKNLANSTENQLISPMSIQTIMGLLQVGSTGKCLDELAKVLYLPKKVSLLKETFKNYMHTTKNANIDVTTANKIYVAERFQLPKQYEKLSKAFNAGVQKINSSNTQQTINEINHWVENQTNHKIKDLVDDNIINVDTAMVLVNALYFNAHWKYPFDDEMTQPRNFYVNEKDKMKTDMMIQVGNFNYTNSKVLDAKLLELPYEDEDYVMNIVLPNDKNGLENLMKKLGEIFQELNSDIFKFEEEEVSVLLPKFKYGNKITLNDVLKKMGINSIFDQMQLKGQKSKQDLKVSNIVQKTFIDVNEKGSEAAAATAVGIEDRMGGYDKIYFIADHPFIFLIRHKPSRVVLFMGIYKKP